jgi:hypothetical protein
MSNNVMPISSRPDTFLAGYSTREQLSRQIGRTIATLRKWEKRGLPVIKQGNLRLYHNETVRQWILGELPAPEARKPGRPTGR